MRRVLLIPLLLTACRAHMEAPLPKPFSFPMHEAGAAVRALERDRARYLAGPDAWMYWQAAAQYRALAGDLDGALAAWDQPGMESKGEAPSLEGFGPEDAATVVLREAERRQALFINEAHHDPRHRAFTRALLQGLHDRGYRYFAAEAFSETDADLSARGVPVRATGGYVSEPQFAGLVREALRLGFQPVPYEDQTECPPAPPDDPQFCANRRDRIQAENLKARVFDKDPRAKVVVHAGFDHIRKDSRGGWRTMAGVFKDLTGIDPLCVDQVALSPRSTPAFEHAGYKAALAAFSPASPVVISAGDGKGWLLPGDEKAFDFHVLFPRPATVSGRPDWLIAGASPVPFPPELCSRVPCTVAAYRDSEDPALAVPVDALVVRQEGGVRPALALAPGRYRVRAEGPDGAAAEAFVEAR